MALAASSSASQRARLGREQELELALVGGDLVLERRQRGLGARPARRWRWRCRDRRPAPPRGRRSASLSSACGVATLCSADRATRLRAAQVDVGRRDLGHQRHPHGVAVSDRCGGVGVGRLDAASHAAEQVDLPRGGEAVLVLAERVDEARNGGGHAGRRRTLAAPESAPKTRAGRRPLAEAGVGVRRGGVDGRPRARRRRCGAGRAPPRCAAPPPWRRCWRSAPVRRASVSSGSSKLFHQAASADLASSRRSPAPARRAPSARSNRPACRPPAAGSSGRPCSRRAGQRADRHGGHADQSARLIRASVRTSMRRRRG